jgi:predicted nucleic acid-binding protein
VTWSSEAARDTATTLAHSSGGEVDWDEGAGEEWLRIIDGTRLIALVSTVLPLIFALRNKSESEGFSEDVVVVPVDDFDAVQLSCSLAILSEAFGASERLRVLDPKRFSANDLWYATV